MKYYVKIMHHLVYYFDIIFSSMDLFFGGGVEIAFNWGATHWWQLCHSQAYRGLLGRKSAEPWFFTRWGNLRRTRVS